MWSSEVIENDVHPQTLTSDTGDANWETCHVTFDHGGKVPYIEGLHCVHCETQTLPPIRFVDFCWSC